MQNYNSRKLVSYHVLSVTGRRLFLVLLDMHTGSIKLVYKKEERNGALQGGHG